MLKGVAIRPLKRFVDERGAFSEIMRVDWKDLFQDDKVVQANLSSTYPNIIRAWHRHLRGQTDYFVALRGAIRIGIYDDKSQELNEVFSTEQELQVVRVPGHYWHGFKAIGQKPALMLYFTTRLYDPSNPDEERKPWNDQTVVPKIINSRKDDPRNGKPWDWNNPPHM
jgi:dTDP-4-dehydrorhamnose 3,5-epimerase